MLHASLVSRHLNVVHAKQMYAHIDVQVSKYCYKSQQTCNRGMLKKGYYIVVK